MHALSIVALDLEYSCCNIHEHTKDLSQQDIEDTLIALVQRQSSARRLIVHGEDILEKALPVSDSD